MTGPSAPPADTAAALLVEGSRGANLSPNSSPLKPRCRMNESPVPEQSFPLGVVISRALDEGSADY
jgi:hypothetical protein